VDELPVFVVDAFSSSDGPRPLLGNPAAVVLLSEAEDATRPDAWRLRVAAEMKHSETAFAVSLGNGEFGLRWFTPEVEVDLCGHATLASAHVLWESGVLPATSAARFQTRSGILTAALESGLIELDFPVQEVEPVLPPAGLLGVLGMGKPALGVFRAADDWLVEVERAAIEELKPDFILLRKDSLENGVRGVIVTSEASPEERVRGIDFVSRFFGPAVGVDEDPVTGSAHTKLAPFWSGRLGKREMWGYQASARGGMVRVRLRDKRVLLGGQAFTTLRGTLLI
jgi:PhzF family phenazine biosynthesis protein